MTAQAVPFAPEAPLEADQAALIGETAWHRELVNGITLIGRLGATPDLRVFSTGNKKAHGRIGVKKNKAGDTEWYVPVTGTFKLLSRALLQLAARPLHLEAAQPRASKFHMQALPCRFRFEAWGALGEAAAKLPKGAQVHVTGRLATSEWVNKEGQPIQSTFVNVNQINTVDGVRRPCGCVCPMVPYSLKTFSSLILCRFRFARAMHR